MIIKYFDKDGKVHRMNIKTSSPVFIASEIEDGKFAEYRLEEMVHFNEEKNDWTTYGAIKVGVASTSGLAIMPAGDHDLIVKPSNI